MNEKVVFPELLPLHRWQEPMVAGSSWRLQKLSKEKWVNMALVHPELLVQVWKAKSLGGGSWETLAKCETLQQALNMAAALVALGEADE